jgi:hypothetical protein
MASYFAVEGGELKKLFPERSRQEAHEDGGDGVGHQASGGAEPAAAQDQRKAGSRKQSFGNELSIAIFKMAQLPKNRPI